MAQWINLHLNNSFVYYYYVNTTPNSTYVYVTGFAKRGLIHASDFATLMMHNFICGSAMKLLSVMIAKSLHKISEL